MIYCDTSFLIPSLVPEPASQAVRLWLAAQEAGTVCISPWVATEFSSAIAIKLRHGALDGDQQANVLAHWREMQVERLITVPVPGEAFDMAARFCDMKGSSLRAGDALHLAVCSLGGHGLATLDGRMKQGAEAVGVSVVGV